MNRTRHCTQIIQIGTTLLWGITLFILTDLSGRAVAQTANEGIEPTSLSIQTDEERFGCRDGAVAGSLNLLDTIEAPQNRDSSMNGTLDVTAQSQFICTVIAGKRLKIGARLVSSSGKPIRNRAIVFFLNGKKARRIRTDDEGVAVFTTQPAMIAGTYDVHATYKGSAVLGAAQVSAQLIVEPIRLTIEVVPPLAGIHFIFNGQGLVSNQDGIAQLTIDRAGDYELELLTEAEDRGNSRIEFERWRAESFEPHRIIELPRHAALQVGFGVSYQVDQTFIDMDGNPVPEARISSFSYLSSHGALIERTNMDPYWLDANRVTRRRHGLEVVPIQYSLMSVIVDGANVVNRKQQRFFAEKPDDIWQLTLIFYEAIFTAQDALFGFPLGNGVNLEYPDGTLVHHPANANGEVFLESLARGEYKVQAAGVRGMAPVTPVAITRFQDVPLKVISYLDMGLVLGLGFALALGLLLAGRPQLIRITIGYTQRLADIRIAPGKLLAPQSLVPHRKPRQGEKTIVYAAVDRRQHGTRYNGFRVSPNRHQRNGSPMVHLRYYQLETKAAGNAIAHATLGRSHNGRRRKRFWVKADRHQRRRRREYTLPAIRPLETKGDA